MTKQFRLDENLNEQIRISARKLKMTESLFIREAIMAYISKVITTEEAAEALIKKYNMDQEDIARLKKAINKMGKDS